MKGLTNLAEDLLREVIDHRNDSGLCDTQYWKERFDSATIDEDVLLRSLFKELKEAEMISMSWADDYPYTLYLLGNGLSYFDEKQHRDITKGINSYTNNFYGSVNGVQIQQGTSNSSQGQHNLHPVDDLDVIELIQTIRKYDSVLDSEYGEEDAEKLRNAACELSELSKRSESNKEKRYILEYLRDLSVNAGGGIIATGIVQLISKIMG